MLMQSIAPLRGYRRRVGDLSAEIERLGPHQWHVTIMVMQTNTSSRDPSVPVIDLGVFPSIAAANSATDLIVNSWSRTSEHRSQPVAQ
jgi:hypothetical protein